MIDTSFSPRNVVTTFENEFGDTKIIHRPKGSAMKIYKGGKTPVLAVNRAISVLMGRRIRARREALGMTMEQLGIAAGLMSQTPKQYIYSMEKSVRKEGVRLGTLFLLAKALGCSPADLLPSIDESMDAAGVSIATVSRMVVA